MALLRKLILATLLFGVVAARAASFGENRAYSAAAKAFQDETWWLADGSFGQFVDRFPKSEWRPQAVLYQAIARFHLTNSAGCIDLLRANLDRAGPLADEYQFWIAEGCFQKADFGNAATAYAELLQRHASSKRRLEALVNEAACRSRTGDWTSVVARLGSPEGEFLKAVATASTNVLIVRGALLLGEAQLALKNQAGVEQAVAPLRGQKLPAEFAWRAERLSYEAQFISGRFADALATSSNLVALAGAQQDLRAESVAMQATVLEKLERLDQARAVYELNLAPGTRAGRQRQALLKLSELALKQGNMTEVTNQLGRFLNLSSNEPAADLALLTLGEIHLRRYTATPATNAAAGGDLDFALGLFNRLVTTFTNSEFIGKAEWNRGWCFWLKTNQLAESAVAFERAIQHPSLGSEDRIVAHIKLGDALFLQNDFPRALENYQQAAARLESHPALREAIGGDLYLLVLRAGIKATNAAAQNEAVAQIMKLPPRDHLADRALILAIQGVADSGDPRRARADFEKFIAASPESPLRPVVELVIGSAREQQGDWTNAIAGYEQWLTRFPTNAERPRAEFQLAWSYWQAGYESNAYSGFTNFLASHASSELAPQAQWWLADYFWRQGDHTEAERNYKTLVEKWPGSELAYLARLKAGQAALGGLRYDDAINHFTNLTSDVKLIERAPELWAQAAFAYGDTLMTRASGDKTNQFANFQEAIRVFGQIQLRFSTASNEIAVLALGEAARCWRQLPGGASNALTAFSQVATSAVASVAARSEALVGLAGVYADLAQTATGEEQRGLLREAVRQLRSVVDEENLRNEHEQRNAFWVRRAGSDAGALLEKLGDWTAAEKLYLRLQELLPPLQTNYLRKIEQLRERQRAAQNTQPGI